MTKTKEIIFDNEYKQWLQDIKNKIASSQIKAAIAVNNALIEFYFELGQMIVEKQAGSMWGDKIIGQLSQDLRLEFPDLKGVSTTNLKYCKRFYLFYQKENNLAIGQQAVDQFVKRPMMQIPWGHNILIFTKSNELEEAGFYIQQTIDNNWSRDTLALQIKSDLYRRQGKAVNNFKHTLPVPQADLAEQTIKDPYVFDFLTFTKPYKRKGYRRSAYK